MQKCLYKGLCPKLSTNIAYMTPPFQVIIDCPFKDITKESTLTPIDNKYSLCMVNDFEDGKWNLEAFHDFIWDNIAQTALNKEEREALGGRPSTLLKLAAKNLRITDKDVSGGEIAEILLYSIMKHHYNALPVVPKIYYKQNANDFAKGADSVHIVIEDEENFSFWLGEAKFYNKLENARLNTVVESVHDTLMSDKIKKENSIILGIKDLNELEIPEILLDKIKCLLDKDTSLDKLKPHLHVPILLLHECEITSKAKLKNKQYLDSIKEQYADRATSYFKKQIEKCQYDIFMYSDICFHLMLIPVPNKEEIVNMFVNRAKAFR